MRDANEPVRLNGVSYRWPKKPVVVVCIDGGDPAYIEHGLARRIIPKEHYHRPSRLLPREFAPCLWQTTDGLLTPSGPLVERVA